jgi:hypothetical protein
MGRNIFGDDGTRADDAALSDCHARQNECACSDKSISADGNFRRSKRYTRLGKIVAAGAEKSFLGNGSALPDFDFAK